jgi:hypothetical protein
MIGVFINNTVTEIKKAVNLNNYNKLKKNFTKCIIIDNLNNFSNMLKNTLIDDINNDFLVFYEKNIENETETNENNYIKNIDFAIKKAEIFNYEFITFIYDNYIYASSLNNYFNYVNLKKNIDIFTYSDSSELDYNLQIYILTINYNTINNFINFIKKENYSYNNILFNLPKIFNKSTSYLKIAYNESNINKNILINNDYLYKKILNDNELEIISLDKIEICQRNSFDDSIFTELPYNFDLNIYREHADLYDYSDDFLKKHFINFGQFEKRKYTDNNYLILLPKFIRKLLLEVDLLKYFDFPEKFDLFIYREFNQDLNNLTIYELFKHWYDYGQYENRIYNQ